MRIYDRRGMLMIPSPRKRVPGGTDGMLLVKACYCQNGHNLICNQLTFNNFNGIYLRAQNGKEDGFIGLSPVYGEKCRIGWKVDLVGGEIFQFFCPTCNVSLPVFSPCHCGADIITFFLNPEADYAECIGICNRVNCSNSVVRSRGELLSLADINIPRKRSGLIQGFLNLG